MALSNFPLTILSFIFFAKSSIAIEKQYYDLDLSKSLFQSYIFEHNKQYNTEAEATYRHQVFRENLQTINKLNQEHESTVFGLTPFSDLSQDEFLDSISCLHGLGNSELVSVPNIRAPAALDYREQKLVTEVKDQGNCGSCYIFGAMVDIEGQYAKLHKNLISLSEQYPLDCGDAFSCFGGSPDDVMNWLAKQNGAISTKDYPYHAAQEDCQANTTKAVVKVKGGKHISVNGTNELKQYLANHGPLTVALFAGYNMQHYKGGVFPAKNCNVRDPNHAVALVGYGTDKENFWIVKNSWGESWGERGYMRLAMGKCDVEKYMFPSEVL